MATQGQQAANGDGGAHKQKKLILNAFVMNSVGHLSPGLWRHPGNKTTEYKSIKFWTELAQLLDNAGFHAMFVADVLGMYGSCHPPKSHIDSNL